MQFIFYHDLINAMFYVLYQGSIADVLLDDDYFILWCTDVVHYLSLKKCQQLPLRDMNRK